LVIDVKGKEQSPPPNGIPRELIMKFASGYPGEKKAPTLGTHVLDAMTGPIDAKSRIIVAELPAGTSLSDIQIFIAQSGSTGQVAAKSFLVGTLPTVMHAKNLIVDGKTAFVLGSPMQQKYYGDAKHKIKDAVRGEHSLGIKVPIHDVSAKVEGPVVEHIHNGFFVPHWNKGAPPTQQESAIEFSGSPPGSCKLQVVRSIGGTRHWTPMFEDLPKGEAGILEAYQRAIASAEDYIYFENQYFTCAAIVTALVLALKSKPNLHVIGLINPNLEMITLRYGYYQNRAIRRLYKELNTDERKRFRLYTLWTSEAGENGNPRLLRTYVHAKVAIVDDKWATVGSANLDGVSLLKNEYIAKDGKSATAPNDFANPEDSVDTSYRSSEINLLLLSPADKVRALKETLWREHLGISDSDPFPSTNPGALWRETAGRRLGTLCGSTPTATDPARILPWPVDAEDMGTEATSLFEGCGEYLGALSTSDGRKIDFSKVKVEERGSSFSFATAEFKA
jgi:phosphatidylserine/phosphatidylglycerophosphate/cardiolipin synthase-like enzyme